MISFNGQSVALKPLTERLKEIAEVVRLYRAAVEVPTEGSHGHHIPPDHPFSLIGKSFLPKKMIRELLKHIKTDRSERMYV